MINEACTYLLLLGEELARCLHQPNKMDGSHAVLLRKTKESLGLEVVLLLARLPSRIPSFSCGWGKAREGHRRQSDGTSALERGTQQSMQAMQKSREKTRKNRRGQRKNNRQYAGQNNSDQSRTGGPPPPYRNDLSSLSIPKLKGQRAASLRRL